MTDSLWSHWSACRPPRRVVHLDSGAAGRSSLATIEAVARHLRREAECGVYVAQSAASGELEFARSALAGLLGVPADGVAFVESGSAARQALLDAWPLAEGDRVAIVAAEWGPNLEAFTERGLSIVEVDVNRDGAVRLDRLAELLVDDPPALVHLTQVTSHRGLVQPVASAAALCRAAGVPLWVDAAQAVGHVDTATGADAVYATSRKWLTGPRGVGVLAVAPRHWDALRIRRPAMAEQDLPPVHYLESHEANVAGRVGLANAVREYLELGPERVAQRLDEVGTLTRESLVELDGWTVVDGRPGSGAITALRPAAGQDVVVTRERLLAEHGILTTACREVRAPRDSVGPLLRVSPHVDCTPEDLGRLRAALVAGS